MESTLNSRCFAIRTEVTLKNVHVIYSRFEQIRIILFKNRTIIKYLELIYQ